MIVILLHLYSNTIETVRNTKITLAVCPKTFKKDPVSSELGERILKGSIDLIDEIGFEDFTFKKLGAKIKSTEASIYRYFESKYHLVSYLVSWYWSWMEYKLIYRLANIDSSEEKLKRSIKVITEKIEQDSNFLFIDEVKLFRIVVNESSKVYMNKKVDETNQLGFFGDFKRFVELVSEVVLECNPMFKYPHMLVSTIIEGVHHQYFFAEHLPRLTDVIEGEEAIEDFYSQMAMKVLEKK